MIEFQNLSFAYPDSADGGLKNIDLTIPDGQCVLLAELTHNKTVVMIAHRLKTVRYADRIFVVDHGEIVQQGTHDERCRPQLFTGGNCLPYRMHALCRIPGGIDLPWLPVHGYRKE